MKYSRHRKSSQTIIVCLLGAACVVALIVLIAVARTSAQETTIVVGDFIPPAFESAAVTGVPEVPDELGWSELNIRSGYVVHVCGVLSAEADKTVAVWFSSDAENDVWLKLRMMDMNENIIGETGIIRPGEYVERITLTEIPKNDAPVVLLIMGYEPETYYSAGTVSLASTLISAG